jgi:hypothetical protein
VLHLAGGVAFGVDVGDLLELERAFEGDGVVDAAAEEEEVAGGGEGLGELLALVVDGAEDLFDLAGDAAELGRRGGGRLGRGDGAADLGEVEGEEKSAVSWAVKALVEATPISGPALVVMVPWASRVTAWRRRRCRWRGSWSRGRSARAGRRWCRRFRRTG